MELIEIFSNASIYAKISVVTVVVVLLCLLWFAISEQGEFLRFRDK